MRFISNVDLPVSTNPYKSLATLDITTKKILWEDKTAHLAHAVEMREGKEGEGCNVGQGRHEQAILILFQGVYLVTWYRQLLIGA